MTIELLPGQPIRALTLLQPWATLVAIGAKHNETRGWSTPYRGPLAIHASKTMPAEARDFALHNDYCRAVLNGLWGSPAQWDFPLGKVLAVCRIASCKRITLASDLTTVDPQELAFGDYTAGRYAWALRDVRAIPPVPATGKQGLWWWQVPTDIR